MIKVNDKTRITKSAYGWDIQILKGEGDAERWTTRYYYSTLACAVNGAINMNMSNRKPVNIEEVELFIKSEVMKTLSKLEVL